MFSKMLYKMYFFFFTLQCKPYNEIISLFSESNFIVKPLLDEMDQPLLKPKIYAHFNLYIKFYINPLKCLVLTSQYHNKIKINKFYIHFYINVQLGRKIRLQIERIAFLEIEVTYSAKMQQLYLIESSPLIHIQRQCDLGCFSAAI